MKKNIRRKICKMTVLTLMTMLLVPAYTAMGGDMEDATEETADAADPITGGEETDESMTDTDETADDINTGKPSDDEPAKPDEGETLSPSDKDIFEDITDISDTAPAEDGFPFEPINNEETDDVISKNGITGSGNEPMPYDENAISGNSVSGNENPDVKDEDEIISGNEVSENSVSGDDIIEIGFPAKIDVTVDPFRLEKRERIFSEKYEITNRGSKPVKMVIGIEKLKAERELDGCFELTVHTDETEMTVKSGEEGGNIELELEPSVENDITGHIWITGDIYEESLYYHLETEEDVESLSDRPLDITLRYSISQ